MPRCNLHHRILANCYNRIPKRTLSVEVFFFICCLSFGLSLLWIQINEEAASASENPGLVQEALENVARDSRFAEVYRKTSRLPKDLKYVLLWTSYDYSPFYYFGKGQRMFIKQNCSVINCYITSDRKFFNGDLTKFDAVAFNGRNLNRYRVNLPKKRSPHQKYIFVNTESSDNYPVCNEAFDGFFNLTSTYRLDSDIPYPYIKIRDKAGKVVGPKKDVKWIEEMRLSITEDTLKIIQNKSKAVAWFVSNCSARSRRHLLAKQLESALAKYHLTVDIYGSCGTLQCPREGQSNCSDILEKDYYFYLSLENSFAEDYVTEKLLTALQNNVVPIVYGGADYSRFLPPGSYLDSRKLKPTVLAAVIARLISSPMVYAQFFKWKTYYTYHDPTRNENVCGLCKALNNGTMMETKMVHHNFREWWNPEYTKRCKSWWKRFLGKN